MITIWLCHECTPAFGKNAQQFVCKVHQTDKIGREFFTFEWSATVMKKTVHLQDMFVVMLSLAAETNFALNWLKNWRSEPFFFSYYYLFIERADIIAREVDASAKRTTRLGGVSGLRKMVENHDHDFVQGCFAACSSFHHWYVPCFAIKHFFFQNFSDNQIEAALHLHQRRSCNFADQRRTFWIQNFML